MKHSILLALTAAALVAGPLAAQATPPVTPAHSTPDVGATAPDFSLPGSTRYGLLSKPVRLSDFRGKTVVLAFFPAARTRGCTVQMRAFRDDYHKIFHNGRNVVVIAISTDPVQAQQTWAAEEDFPVIFASDPERRISGLFGAYGEGNRVDRSLFVVDATGRIAYRVLPFNEVDPEAYEALGKQIDRLVGGR